MIKIRKATKKDFEQLRDIRKKFYLYETKLDPLSNPKWANIGMPSLLSKDLKRSDRAYFIALDNKKIIGYAGNEIERLPAWYYPKKAGHLFNLYVKKEYQKRGIGKKLVNVSLNWFKKNNIKFIKILTYANNKKAKKIYKKFGFKDYIYIHTKLLK